MLTEKHLSIKNELIQQLSISYLLIDKARTPLLSAMSIKKQLGGNRMAGSKDCVASLERPFECPGMNVLVPSPALQA